MTDTGSPKPRIKLNKWWLIGGGIAAAGVYYVYAKRSSVAAANTTAATDSSIDPSTGLSYAEEGSDYTTSGSPYSYLSSSAPGGGYAYPSSSTVATDNSAYAKSITDYLTNNLGYSSSVVQSALQKWLSGSGQALTPQESTAVQAAIVYGGAPPVSVASPNYTANGGQAGGFNNVPYITGDPNQDYLLSTNSYLKAAHDAYLSNQTPATQDAYLKLLAQVQGQNPLSNQQFQPLTTPGQPVPAVATK